jgi:hypothetical protein
MRSSILSMALGLLLTACAQPGVLRSSTPAVPGHEQARAAEPAPDPAPERIYEASWSIAHAPRGAQAWCLSAGTAQASVNTSSAWRRVPTPAACASRYAPKPPETEAEALERCRRVWCARRKSNILTGVVCGGVIAYGLVFWNYGENEFNFQDDGWFEEDTKSGGADKVGHVVAARVMTAIFAAVNRHWGLDRKESALRAALTTFTYMSVMEFGDGFTRLHGFTYGDVVANGVGCLFGYLDETWPWFGRVFDLRWEYFPSEQVWSGEDLDITTDYEGSAYLLAINTGALVSRRRHVLELVDLQVGYYTRHYQDLEGPPERHVFAGVGLNLSTVFRWLGMPRVGKVFEYWQPPYISLRLDWEL